MKYRAKPIIVEAVKWTGENQEELRAFCPKVEFADDICTLNGFWYSSQRWWLIRKDEEFEMMRDGDFSRYYEPDGKEAKEAKEADATPINAELEEARAKIERVRKCVSKSCSCQMCVTILKALEEAE